MEEKNHKHNGFGNGFLLGLLIGILATLLVTTKKGRELLKEFTEKGLDKFSDLENKLQEKVAETEEEFEEFDEGDDYIPEQPTAPAPRQLAQQEEKIVSPKVSEEKSVNKPEHYSTSNGNGAPKPSARPHRFFRKKS